MGKGELMGRLFCCGDTHQDIDIHKLNSTNFKIGNELIKEDIMVILGDAGFVWSYGIEAEKQEKYWRNWITNKPWTTFAVCGNHEAFSLIKEFPIVEFCSGHVYKITDSLFYAISGEIYNLNGKTCLVINGADSQDKNLRKEGVSWWPEEQITEEDIQKAKFNLKRYNNKVDYLLTHTGGVNVCASLGFKPTISDVRLSQILNTFQYDYHYLGHYHVDKTIDNKTRIFYNDIKEIY